MQIAVDTKAIGTFNAQAPALESKVINGVQYEVFHDFYHLRRIAYRDGNNSDKSVGFRISGKPDSFGFSSRSFFKRTSKAQKALAAWINEMVAKYGTPSVMEDS